MGGAAEGFRIEGFERCAQGVQHLRIVVDEDFNKLLKKAAIVFKGFN